MKRRCFADCGDKCTALEEKICDTGEKCPFYKTREKIAKEHGRCNDRLINMGYPPTTYDKNTRGEYIFTQHLQIRYKPND